MYSGQGMNGEPLVVKRDGFVIISTHQYKYTPDGITQKISP